MYKFIMVSTYVKKNCAKIEKCMRKQPFNFVNDSKAARYNTKILTKYEFDYKTLISKCKGTILSPGSKFRSIANLSPLLQYHEDWESIKQMLSVGIIYPMTEQQTESERISDITAMIKRGNHPSVMRDNNFEVLQKAYDKEVKHGWLIPLQVSALPKIKNAGIITLGIAQQFTVDAEGNRISKGRATHDCSFEMPSVFSINNETIDKELELCIYGYCIRRLLHLIHMMRYRHPKKNIYIIKLDLDAA